MMRGRTLHRSIANEWISQRIDDLLSILRRSRGRRGSSGSARATAEELAAALAEGGMDEGAPGLRPFHANFYAAFVRDHDGNKLAAVCEKPE